MSWVLRAVLRSLCTKAPRSLRYLPAHSADLHHRGSRAARILMAYQLAICSRDIIRMLLPFAGLDEIGSSEG